MSELTGLSPDFIERANLRVDLSRFRKELMRNERRDDRSLRFALHRRRRRRRRRQSGIRCVGQAISGAFIGTFNNYLANDLGYDRT